MNSLEKVKRQFTLILASLGVVALLLLVYLLWPGSSPSAKQAHEEALQQQEIALSREVAPLKNIDKQLAQTRGDVKKFYEQKVPNEFSAISQHLEKLMQETGVATQGIHYPEQSSDQAKSDLPDVQRIGIDTTVTGDYAKIAKFINALEQDKYIFVIDQITLSSSEASNVVSLQIKFETFLKQT